MGGRLCRLRFGPLLFAEVRGGRLRGSLPMDGVGAYVVVASAPRSSPRIGGGHLRGCRFGHLLMTKDWVGCLRGHRCCVGPSLIAKGRAGRIRHHRPCVAESCKVAPPTTPLLVRSPLPPPLLLLPPARPSYCHGRSTSASKSPLPTRLKKPLEIALQSQQSLVSPPTRIFGWECSPNHPA